MEYSYIGWDGYNFAVIAGAVKVFAQKHVAGRRGLSLLLRGRSGQNSETEQDGGGREQHVDGRRDAWKRDRLRK